MRHLISIALVICLGVGIAIGGMRNNLAHQQDREIMDLELKVCILQELQALRKLFVIYVKQETLNSSRYSSQDEIKKLTDELLYLEKHYRDFGEFND